MNSSYCPASSRRPAKPASDRGSALFLLLILSVVMATVIGAVITYINQTAKIEKRSNLRLEATYAAEYAFERAFQNLNTLVNQDNVNLPTIAQTTGVTNLTTAPTDVFTAANGYAWKTYLTVPVENGAVVGAHAGFNSTQGTYKFLSVVEFTHTVPTMNRPIHVQFQREWSYVLTPLFQYAIFYDRDMELFPGANFIVGGRVHSNGKIYTGTSASITFSDYVSYVGGLSNQYHPLDPRAPGSPGSTITYNKGTTVTTREDPPGSGVADLTDVNTNNDGTRELIEIPDSWQTDANSGQRLYNKAGLKVLVNSSSSALTAGSAVTVPANSRVFLTADGTAIPASDPLASYLATMFSTGSMQDYREGSAVTTTDVDVSKVNTAYDAGGLPQTVPSSSNWPNNSSVPSALKNQAIPDALRGKSLWNGVLYVADIANSSTHRAGLKIVNGTNLPDGTNSSSPTAGLTIVSDNAAYIVGDYNTGGTPPVDSGSSAVTANNYAAGYTVKPAAVIADAITVVSSSWISGNYNSTASLSSRPAANTTINTAMISGVVSSDGTAYSGGVENYIRLLENWSGHRLTYYGSMINLFESKQSTAHWQNTGVYYNAPTRNWYFDVNFLDPNKLPPGTPILRSLKRGQWTQID
jgi:hypothetical protein